MNVALAAGLQASTGVSTRQAKSLRHVALTRPRVGQGSKLEASLPVRAEPCCLLLVSFAAACWSHLLLLAAFICEGAPLLPLISTSTAALKRSAKAAASRRSSSPVVCWTGTGVDRSVDAAS